MQHNYYQHYSGYFWTWEEACLVIDIPNGSTIAYKAYIKQIVQCLSLDKKCPPLGAILLLIVATNKNFNNDLELIREILHKKIRSWQHETTVEKKQCSILFSALSFLSVLKDLPDSYKTKEGRLILFQTLLADHPYIGTVDVDPPEDQMEVGTLSSTVFLKDFQYFAQLKALLPNVDAILQKIQDLPTVEELEIPEEDQLSIAEDYNLVEDLLEQETSFPIAALIPAIWTGLKIPINSAIPSQQRLGGVSDITNKGNFNQLLISEYANDDLIFLSRLANQEALYIQREQPPISNAFQRILLIDISIFNWGTPKIMNFATALAIAKHPKAKDDCQIVLLGQTQQPILLNQAHQVIASLQKVSAHASAVDGLNDFFEKNKHQKQLEVVFLTCLDSLKDKLLEQTLIKYRKEIQYSVIAHVDGLIQLYKHQTNGRRLLQKIKLDLNKLWANSPTKRLDQHVIIPHSFQSPLLFPISTGIKRVLIASDDSTFMFASGGTILKTYDHSKHSKGCIEILKNTKKGYKMSVGLNELGEYIYFQFNHHTRSILIRNLSTAKEWTTTFSTWENSDYKNFIYRNGAFHYYGAEKNWQIRIHEDHIVIEELVNLPSDWKTHYQERKQNALQLKNNLNQKASVLKNIHQIFIHENGGLVFNKHKLYRNTADVFKLEYAPKEKALLRAKKLENGYRFPDGSCVVISRLGMLQLRSSSTDIADIYIPTVLNAALGLATDEYFAGFDYYNNPSMNLTIISTAHFEQTYLKRFVEHILTH